MQWLRAAAADVLNIEKRYMVLNAEVGYWGVDVERWDRCGGGRIRAITQ